MIIYDDRQKQSLFEFGIEIPVHDSRAIHTFQKLKDHPRLGQYTKTWHIDSINENITRDDLQRAHSRGFVENLFSDQLEQEIIRTFELIDPNGRYHRYNPANASQPLTDLFDRILLKVAATVQCCRVALKHGFCFSFGGGNHHAQFEYGAGFCLLNDIVIALRKLQAEDIVRSAWVIDLDAHKGDGTAALTRGDDSIKTLSIHMAHGWPLDGEPFDSNGNLNPSFTASDIDIPVEAGQDDMYLSFLQNGLRTLEKNALPDLTIVVSGVDPYEKDELPSADKLKLSLAQMKQRDQLVYRFLKQRHLPRAYLMAGGYGEKSWEVYTQFLEWVLLERLELYVSSISKK